MKTEKSYLDEIHHEQVPKFSLQSRNLFILSVLPPVRRQLPHIFTTYMYLILVF